MAIVQIKKKVHRELLKSGDTVVRCTYVYDASSDTATVPDSAHRLIDSFTITELLAEITETEPDAAFFNKEFAFERTGWQSWDAGWELAADEQPPRYKSFLMPALKNYINVPETNRLPRTETAQFITWFRWKGTYLVLASTGQNTPPVQYQIDRKKQTVAIEVYANGKIWQNGETVAELCFFLAEGYFALKNIIHELYYTNRFSTLDFLGSRPGGWESWYNHYNKIDQKLMLDDLESLDKTNNLIKLMYIDRKKPAVFQIDDGWQQGVGQWEVRKDRFPDGLVFFTKQVRKKGYIPGLWMAPFAVDYRTAFIQKHKDWILRDEKGKPVPAGFNAPWGDALGRQQPSYPHTYFVLDLSRDDVLEHLDYIIDRAINDWGFRYLKLDFLFTGMLYGKFANGGAAYQWFNRAVQTLTKRKTADNGEPVAYLGCGMPFEASRHCFPLSRIGADTLEAWDRADLKLLDFPGRPSAYISMKDTLGHAFWNNSVYLNDPDVVFFRTENCTLSANEKELLALVNFMFAGQIMHSDDPAAFNPETEEPITRQVLALYDKLEGEDFGNLCIEHDIYVVFSKSGTYSGILNLSENDFTIDESELISCIQLGTSGNSTSAAEENTDNHIFDRISVAGTIFDTADGPVFCVPPHSVLLLEDMR